MTMAVQTKNIPPVRPHLWTREEFDNMVLAGIFQPEARLELIEGEILEMGTQSILSTAIDEKNLCSFTRVDHSHL